MTVYRLSEEAYAARQAARAKAEAAERTPVLARYVGDAKDRPSAAGVLESVVLKAVIKALALHPRVAWATRMNTGAVTLGPLGKQRYVRFGFKGCPDIIGQMRDGRFLAVEVKKPKGKASEDQLAFIYRVRNAGGVAFVAWSVDDVWRELGR